MIDAAVYSNVFEFNLDLAGEINIIILKETPDYETSFPDGFKGANLLKHLAF